MSLTKQEANSHDIRTLIQREFIKRCKKNPSYSLRAFSKFLEVDQSALSKILRGKRNLASTTALKVGVKLGLKPSEIPKKRSASLKHEIKTHFLPLSDDEFSAISDWRHFAVLELFKTRKFKPNEAFFSRRLGIHVEEVRSIIQRLQRTGLISIKDKTWNLNSANNTWTNTAVTTEARKILQKELLRKAIEAIETIPYENRENGSLTVAISKKDLPIIKEKISHFRKELGEYIQRENNLEEVYQLTVSFFPLTKNDGE